MFALERASKFKVSFLIQSLIMRSPGGSACLELKGMLVFDASPRRLAFLNLLGQWRMTKAEIVPGFRLGDP